MMNNSLQTIDIALLSNISGGAADGPLQGGPAQPSFNPGGPLQGGPAQPSFNPGGPLQGGPAQPSFNRPALPPEMQRWVDDMRALEPWFQLGKAATKI